MKRVSVGLSLLLLVLAPTRGHTAAETEPVQVELAIRGPDALALADTTVTLAPPDDAPTDFAPQPTLAVRTDAQGIVRFRYPAGVFRLSVTANGIGYGMLGFTEFIPDEIVKPELAPLVPFGHIIGRVPPQARRAGVAIYAASSFGPHRVPPVSVIPDEDGRFDVPAVAGRWQVWATAGDSGAEWIARLPHPIDVHWGQRVQDADLIPVVSQASRGRAIPKEKGPTAEATYNGPQVWVRGRVCDESGHPVAGASVLALARDFNGRFMEYASAEATTDAQGRYELLGEGEPPGSVHTIFAIAPGKAPAWGWPSPPIAPEPPTHRQIDYWLAVDTDVPLMLDRDPLTADLVLPSRSGNLEVTVLRDGKPVGGVSVAAHLDNVSLDEVWLRRSYDKAGLKGLEDAVYPVATTKPDGTVRFERLLPGRYRILAAPGDPRSMSSFSTASPTSLLGTADGVGVDVDKTTSFKLAVSTLSAGLSFRLLGSDIDSVNRGAELSAESVERTELDKSVKFGFPQRDASGMIRTPVDASGLWHVEAKYRTSPVTYHAMSEPYFDASAVLASSLRLDSEFVPGLTARRIEPASASIRVQDTEGNPLRATVQIGDAVGSTNHDGTVRLTGLRADLHGLVYTTATGYTPIDLGEGDDPLPAMAALENHLEILPAPLSLGRNVEAKRVLRPEPVGYIYGVVHAPAGQEATFIGVGFASPDDSRDCGKCVHFRPSTGEFVAGPFRPGTVTLAISNRQPAEPYVAVHLPVEIRPGQVTQIEATAPPRAQASSPPSSDMERSIEGVPWSTLLAHRVIGNVFLADGVTPAVGAQILYYAAGDPTPVVSGMADARGVVQAKWVPGSGSFYPDDMRPRPTAPVMVASLRGVTGAAVIPAPEDLGTPVHIVLPPAISVSGHVAVGDIGRTVGQGTIRVRAEYQSGGFLDEPLSVEVTADADGGFTLGGLTAGAYQVQAALDNIWLSPTVMLQVEDHNPAPVDLKIPSPGAAVLLHLRDVSGKPIIGAAVTLDRPGGPLADALWPKQWISDGAGLVYMPTLEAGSQVLRAADAGASIAIDVPPLPAAPFDVSLTLAQVPLPSSQ